MLKEILSGTFRMRYEFLTSTEHALFDAAFDLHELSFPPTLRRSRESFARAFSDPDFECIAFRESQAIMGYATRWFLPSAVYLESLVVAPEFRGLGLGRQHLHEIVATSRKPVAALVADELPGALTFFLKNGFHLNDTDAVVPPFTVCPSKNFTQSPCGSVTVLSLAPSATTGATKMSDPSRYA